MIQTAAHEAIRYLMLFRVNENTIICVCIFAFLRSNLDVVLSCLNYTCFQTEASLDRSRSSCSR